MRDANGFGLPTPNPNTNPPDGIGDQVDPAPLPPKG